MSNKTSNSISNYTDEFAILSGASVGVVLTHTREPHRVADALRDHAFEKGRNFKVWDCVRGWLTADPQTSEDEWKADGIKDPNQALAKLANEEAGVFVMQYPHWILPKSPAFIQMTKHYAIRFSETRHRLVFVAPLGFTLPTELEDDVTILDMDLPTRDELEAIYTEVMDVACENKGCEPPYSGDEVKRIVSAGQGVTEMEFENAVSRAIVKHKDAFPKIPHETFVKAIMEVKVDVVKRSQVLEIMPTTNISNVGGLDLLKGWMKKRVNCFSEEAKVFGIEAPKGAAFIGPPGTGKSLMSKVTGNLLGVPLIRFDVSKVFNKYVGESEGRVQGALNMLKAMAPCVAFIDEIDKAGLSPSGGGDSGVGTRVLGNILTFMQESDAPIFWVFSANRVQGVPSELLRKGRLDEVFSVSVPNYEERLEILKIHIAKRNHDPEEIEGLEEAVKASDNFVAAELEAAVKDALIDSFETGEELTGELIAKQLGSMKPISEAFAEDFNAMREWAEKNAKPSSSTLTTKPVRKVGKNATRPRQRRRNLDS